MFTFLRNDDAVTSVEYAVVLAMILMAILVTIGVVGAQSGGMWNFIIGRLQATGFIP